MFHIKPILSVILWLAFFGLVDASLSWDFQHLNSQVIATVSGTVPDCGGADRRRYEAGELMTYKIKCNNGDVYKYTWNDEAKLNIYNLPLAFSSEDSYSPVGVPCVYTVSSCSLFTLPLRFDPCPFPFVSLDND